MTPMNHERTFKKDKIGKKVISVLSEGKNKKDEKLLSQLE